MTGWLLAHRRSLLLIVAVIALGGVVAALRTPVALFPQVAFPRVVVAVEAGDHPAELMALEATTPLEQALRAVPGVQHIRSVTSRGAVEISLTFGWGEDMAQALLSAGSAVNQAMPQLPAGTTFSLRRMDPTVFPCLGLSLTSETRSPVALRAAAFDQLRPLLARVPGVASVEVQGGANAEWHVQLDLDRLQALGLGVERIAAAVQGANVLAAVGRLEDHGKLALVMADGGIAEAGQLAGLVVGRGPAGVVLLGDVARITAGIEPQWVRVTADGHDAVLIQVFQQPGGSTVAIAAAIREVLAGGGARLPGDISVATWYDQSELILGAARSVVEAIIIGIALSSLVLLVFLRNLTITGIALVAVPAVLLATVLTLKLLGMSFNIMTLGGMAAAVGLIIDDAIVMVEHLVRRIRLTRDGGTLAVLREAAAFTKPLAGSSLATVIIFVPLAFLSGVAGEFFKALSLTMAISLAWSFLMALMVVPLLAALLLRQRDADQEEHGGMTRLVHRAYSGLMRRLLARPWLVVLAIIPLAWAGWTGYQRVGTGFMPVMDEGGFVLDYLAAPGTSLSETDRLVRQVEAILRQTPEVQTYSRRTGLQLGGGLTEANEGDLFVRLKPLPRRASEEIVDEVRQRILREVPGLEIEMVQVMEDLIGDLVANPQPIEIVLGSEDAAALRGAATAVAHAIGGVAGVVDVKDGINLAGDALQVLIDPQRAALEGLDADAIARGIGAQLSGQVATRIQQGPRLVGVRVWTPAQRRSVTPDLAQMRIRTADGREVPLERVARLEAASGQPQIMHDDLGRALAVTARIEQRDLGSVVREIRAVLEQPGLLPAGVHCRIGGLYAQQQAAFADLGLTIGIAGLLVLVLLVGLYERFRVALAMMCTTALSLGGIFIGLWLTGTELNISALMGLTMVVGMVTEVAIIYYSECGEGPDDDSPAERLIRAGCSRMRPIAMTVLAAVFALLPLALGWGQGAAMQQALAIAIISGLLVQVVLVLVVLPALLCWWGADRRWWNPAPPAP
jgi:multidrug efflux pump subunit AcrB